ncbi:hypothetical protein ACFL2R_03840 [Patescibacteria group bacterium]
MEKVFDRAMELSCLVIEIAFESLCCVIVVYFFTPFILPIFEKNIPSGIHLNFFAGNNGLLVDYACIALFFVSFFALLFRRFYIERVRNDQKVSLSKNKKEDVNWWDKDWVGVLFWGALWASFMAPIMQALSDLNLINLILKELFALVWELISPIAEMFGVLKTTEEIWTWYSLNEMKFWFWTVYFSIVTDELGIPNFKTLFVKCFFSGKN